MSSETPDTNKFGDVDCIELVTHRDKKMTFPSATFKPGIYLGPNGQVDSAMVATILYLNCDMLHQLGECR